MKRTVPLMIFLSVVVLFGFGCAKMTSVNKSADQKNAASNSAQEIDRDAILLDAKQQGLIMDTTESDRMKDPGVLHQDAGVQKNTDVKSLLAADLKTWRAGALADVTGGSSFGLVHTRFQNGRFRMVASLGGLPAPGNGSSYEGWLVKRGDSMSVLDTGRIQIDGTQFVNAYVSTQDLSSYDFFVVTLQTTAGNTQPGEHILEGMIR